jgi:outer membrane protein
MRRVAFTAIAALALAAPADAQNPDGKFMIRVRALSLTPADKSDAIASPAVPADAITVSDKIFPEVDLSYFINKSWAVELVLTYPQQHDVKLSGTKIGTFKHLPPSLLLQYHLLPSAKFRPYIGAGGNLTLISDVALNVPGVGALTLDDASVGFALQGGADIDLGGKGWFLNLDAKYVTIGSDVKAGSTKISAVQVNPILLSAGLGVRF